MNPDFQRRIQRYGWDKAAGYYERHWQAQLWPAQEEFLKTAALAPGEHVLDIACGTGLVTFPAAEAVGPDGDVIGTDLSDEMVGAVRRIADARGLKNTDFSRADVEDLPLPEGAFEVVLCSLGIMYVPDPVQALREMHRVLAPGGRALALVWGARKNCGWAEIFPIVDARVASEVCPLFFQQGTGDVLEGTFAAAGFEDIETARLSYELNFSTDDDACAAAFLAGPVALAYHKFSDEVRGEVHAEYLASIAPYRNGRGYDIPGEFVIASGRKK